MSREGGEKGIHTRKMDRKEQEISKKEQERIRREILLHAEMLAEEINFRLLFDADSQNNCQILFVEGVNVIDICYPTGLEKETGFFKRLRVRIKKQLQEIFTYINSLLSHSGRKGRKNAHSIR